MFIGHHAVAFAGKPAAPRMSLGTLMLAATWLDLVWPIFLLLGIEHVRVRGGPNPLLVFDFYDYPWTHSMVTSIGWSIAFAIVYFAVTRYGRGAAIAGALVFSHWVLDFFTHIPDLPLWPHGPTVGLGLWKSPPATIVVEVLLFAIGVFLYARHTRVRPVALTIFVAFLLLTYVASLKSPPPPNQAAIGWGGMLGWLIPIWAWLIDRHREARA